MQLGCNLNTSYVTVKPWQIYMVSLETLYLNTSYVTVKPPLIIYITQVITHLNTSYVTVKPENLNTFPKESII